MSQANTAMKATGGREASRERRAGLVQGKKGLPAPTERSRGGDERTAAYVAPVAAPQQVAVTAPVVNNEAAAVMSAPPATSTVLTGVQASRARRAALVQGKGALKAHQNNATSSASSASFAGSAVATSSESTVPQMACRGRQVAQAMRNSRARIGRGSDEPTRPTGRVRHAEPIQYPAKVAESQSYAGKKVTGVRIGQGMNMTGDEPGSDMQVTGTQYIGRETGLNPREGGVKVGATRTVAGLVVTGTQVRNTVKVTGDESNASLRITGESDQNLGDDLMNRGEQSAYASMQFARQNNPHGNSVFGTNLGRSAKSVGSRERNREYAIEQTDGGMPISGTALGSSTRVTGNKAGSCRTLTGDQYLMPGKKQAICNNEQGQRGMAIGGMMSAAGRPDPASGGKVSEAESWSNQRITGVNIEHSRSVTGAEAGACSAISGTQYVGPGQYENACTADATSGAKQRISGIGHGHRVTGNTARNVEHVTGTHRGSEREISGTAYYRPEAESKVSGNALERIDTGFSVHSPQRTAHLQADATAAMAPTAESRITGTFAAGHGKITGNKEFNFNPRSQGGQAAPARQVTGEGRTDGRAITGSAWGANKYVTGTEGFTAAERNPSERSGGPKPFANAMHFKGKGDHRAPTQQLTGMSGLSPKAVARVTLSGGAQG
jgi:hypothetical protein